MLANLFTDSKGKHITFLEKIITQILDFITVLMTIALSEYVLLFLKIFCFGLIWAYLGTNCFSS